MGTRVVVESRKPDPEALAAAEEALAPLRYPLSDREYEWDLAGAQERWNAYCEGDPDRVAAGMVSASDGLGTGTLQLVDVVDGTPFAVWRAVTEAAAELQDYSEGDAARELLAAYYEQARATYDDAEIAVPWATTPDELVQATVEAPASQNPGGLDVHLRIENGSITSLSTSVSAPALVADAALAEPLLEEPQIEEPAIPVRASQARWTAIFAPEGKATDDGRIFAPGSISWRPLPLSLMSLLETGPGGHEGAQLAGRIDRIWRDEETSERTSLIRAEGIFDDGDYGKEVARLVGDRVLRGNSVDIAIQEYEIGVRSDFVDEDGYWIGDAAPADGEDRDLLDVLFGEEEDLIFVVRKAVIGMSTVCPFPAFEEGEISLMADGRPWRAESDHTTLLWHVWTDDSFELSEGLTASAAGLAPVTPPAEWFADPELEELTPLTVTEDGRIFGHAAAWETCHIALPGCTVAPTSDCDYAYFLLKEVVTEDGARVPCGTITLDAPHADRHLGRQDASAHYDHTGTAVADITVGEDEHGIWVSGALRSDVDAAKVRKLQGAALSGDWRRVNGNLELVALLAVNVPGFPVPRAKALVAAGDDGSAEVLTLVAAGIHDGRTIEDLTDEQRARLAALHARAVGGLEGLAALARRS